jgi:hypothetical protein
MRGARAKGKQTRSLHEESGGVVLDVFNSSLFFATRMSPSLFLVQTYLNRKSRVTVLCNCRVRRCMIQRADVTDANEKKDDFFSPRNRPVVSSNLFFCCRSFSIFLVGKEKVCLLLVWATRADTARSHSACCSSFKPAWGARTCQKHRRCQGSARSRHQRWRGRGRVVWLRNDAIPYVERVA